MLTAEEKQNIAGGFKAASERIDQLEDDYKSATKELQETINQLTRQLKAYGQAAMTGQMDGQQYHRFWRTDDEGRRFGEIILRIMGKRSLSEGVQSEGGILVPDDLASWIIQKIGRYGKFRQKAMRVPLGGDRRDVPKVESDLTIYAPGEGQTITPSEMKFSSVGLTVVKLCCLCAASKELEEDSLIGLAEIIGMSMTRSMARVEDLIGFMGDGTSTYFGMTGVIGALRNVAEDIADIKGLVVANGNAYSEILLDDFRKVVGILPEDFDDTAEWYMNKRFYFDVIYPLAEVAGVANIFEILSPRKDRFLLGYPVNFVGSMPYIEDDSQICAILGDLQMGAYLGERKQLTIDRSAEAYFASDQIGFRGIERIAINAFGVGDTTEPGPIVGLITAAS
jgi:HK97 family phage major capsid protein